MVGGKGKTKLAEQSRISSTTKRKLRRLLILRSFVFFSGSRIVPSIHRSQKKKKVGLSRREKILARNICSRKGIPYLRVDITMIRARIFSKLSPIPFA